MAIYKGREVSLVHDVPKGHVDPIQMSVRQKDGQIETVNVSELQFTKEEKNNIQKTAGDRYEVLNVIEDKDLKELRDSQDKEKIEAEQAKNPDTKDVTIKASNAQVSEGTAVRPVIKR